MKAKNKLRNRILRSIRMAALTGVISMFSAAAFAAVANDTLPTGGQFKAGSGTIMSANGVMTIDQQTAAAAVKWDTFNVGANATINFNFKGAQSSNYNILNYSTNAGLASEIYGRMKAGAGANVWLVNPNGVIIGKGAQIDVGHMHLVSHKLLDTELTNWAGGDVSLLGEHTNAELMSMGNMYVNSISFDGNRVVLDADKLYKFDGTKATFMADGNTGNVDSDAHKIVLNSTGTGGYLDISTHAKEVVVGYTVFDEDKTSADGKNGSYENSEKWRNLYANVDDGKGGIKETRVGFAWVEDSTQLERIGEGTKALSRDFALKDGIAAVNTKEMNDGKGFQPIGADPTNLASPHKTAFTGKFDGLNYDIYGLTINRPDEDDIGLFGYVGDGAIIRNVNLVSGAIVGNNKVGGVVGHAVGNVTLQNVKNSARVLGVDSVGGIVGKAEGASADSIKIINAENVAFIRGKTNVGGIAGSINNTSITGETYNTGAVKGIVDYKNADTAYASKSAAQLTEATYDISAVSTIMMQDGARLAPGTEVTLSRSNGTTWYFVVERVVGTTVYGKYKGYSSAPGGTRNEVLEDAEQSGWLSYNTGTNDYNLIYKNGIESKWKYSNVQMSKIENVTVSDISSNVGGIAGAATNSKIGNTGTGSVRTISEAATHTKTTISKNSAGEIIKVVEVKDTSITANSTVTDKTDAFRIYNDVEVVAGYNLGGIVGSLSSTSASGSVIQNVFNNGNVTAKGYTTDEYYYQSLYYQNHVNQHTNNNTDNMDTHGNVYYGDRTLMDSDWTLGRYMKQTIAVANVGGIVGTATGSSTAVTNLNNVSNYGDILSDTVTRDIDIVTYKSSEGQQVKEAHSTTYSLAGNVGGIIGKAASGTITGTNSESNRNGVTVTQSGVAGVVVDNALNKENHITGASNVGGIIGYALNSSVKNSVNDGGDISITGARNANQENNVMGIYANTNFADRNIYDEGFSHEIARGTVIQSYQYTDYITGNAGGIIGLMFGNDAHVENSRNTGYIHTQDIDEEGVRKITNQAANVGGIVGKIDRTSTLNWTDTTLKEFSDSAAVAVKSSSNTGKVSGYSGIGGIVGQMYNGEIMTSKNLGQISSSFAQNAHNDQANIGGILGDTPAGGGTYEASVKIYDCFNEGIIGDPTFETYGRHVGGVVGRLRGEVSKVYNAGDMYTGSDNIGGIVGFLQKGGVYNVYNKGNITNHYDQTDGSIKGRTSRVGGIVGRIEDNASGVINTAYNLGIIRDFKDRRDINGNSYELGGIIGSAGSGSSITNVYSTGEIYAAYTDASGNWHKAISNSSNNIYSIGPNSSNYRVILAENTGLWSISETASTSYAIKYEDRYNVDKYTAVISGGAGSLNVITPTTTDKLTRTTASNSFRMYLYDEADGVSVSYGAASNTVVKNGVTYTLVSGTKNVYKDEHENRITVIGAMPMLNKYLPYIYEHNLSNRIGSGAGKDIKYIQVGTEYNPLQLNVKLNDGVQNLNINYVESNMKRSALLTVLNGGLNIENINNKDFYLAGNYVALNGDVRIAGSADKLNISANAAFYGNNVTLENTNGIINNNGEVYAMAGNVYLNAKEINNYGTVTAGNKYDGAIVIRGVATSSNDKHLSANDSEIGNYTIQLKNKGLDLYAVSKNKPSSNGNINVTATGDVNLYLGNNNAGLLATEGNLNITGKNVYIDSDIKIGLHDAGNITIKGEDIVFDFSNMGATYVPSAGGTKPSTAELLHTFVNNFSGAKGSIRFQNLDGSATEAKMLLDYFEGNTLNLSKYDDDHGGVSHSLNENLGTMNVYNGRTSSTKVAEDLAFVWVANAAQLKNIQDTYVANKTEIAEKQAILNDTTATEDDKAAARKSLLAINPLQINYALKNSIDASEMTSFDSIGFNGAGVVGAAYTGTFDGRGQNLNSLSPNGSTGLFDTIGATGTVKNLNINASRLNGHTSRVGLVAGTNKGTVDNVHTFGNTVKDANVVGSTPVFIGGLVGFNDQTGIIRNSMTEDIVYAENEKGQTDVGGVAGTNAGVIYSVTGKSDVSVAEGGATSLGGIVGVNAGFIKDVNTLGVTAGLYEHADHTYTGAKNVGGIAGENRTVYQTKDGIIRTDSAPNYEFIDNKGNTIRQEGGGVITDAYNDSKVKGWSSVGGVVGKNFGVGDQLEHKTATGVTVTTTKAADIYYVANAADVIGGNDVGGLAGVNNGAIKGNNTTVDVTVTDASGNTIEYSNVSDTVKSVTDAQGNKVVYGTDTTYTDSNNNKFTFASGTVIGEDASGVAISDTVKLYAAKAVFEAAAIAYTNGESLAYSFNTEYITDTEKALGQTIYGRNSGKITAKSGLEEYNNTTNKTTGTNVGGLIGVSGSKADVDHLLNGKAASVYGKLNVGGLIGLNQGVLQNSTNLMQNNDIAGAMNVGGIVGENSGIIAKIENTNKFNITVNKDYVNTTDGSLKAGITIDGAYEADGKQYASYFGGILGHNAATGTAYGANSALGGIVADVVNTANVTIDHPAYFVGGVMGKNDGTIGYNGMSLYTDAGGNVVRADGYLRNDGAVGVINGENKGSYIGGVIGQNNKAIYMTDITNSIKGTVYGYDYVGGIVGQNTAVISGGRDGQNYANKEATAETGNYYKYDVYNNGMVTGTTNVGGLIGDNAAGGTIKLAYNTGVVKGQNVVRDGVNVNNHNIGGIVGSNEGAVDQVFNSTAPYDKDGVAIPAASLGVHGKENVGGLVGVNAGSISNAYNDGIVEGNTATTGAVVGANTGTLSTSWANVVMDGDSNVTKKLVGINTGTLTNNFSVSEADSNVDGQIKKLAVADMMRTASYSELDATGKWAFYNNAATPLLKNFLTKAYFVPAAGYADAFTYNGNEQGAIVKVENGHVNVYTITKVAGSDPVVGTTPIGEIFAADVNGDHSLKDYLMTIDANADGTLAGELDGQQLIIGKTDGKNANRYSLLFSHQINTNYNQNVKTATGTKERVVNPNMLGFEFFEATIKEEVLNPTNPSDPKYDPNEHIYNPGIPDYLPDGETYNPDKEQSGSIPDPSKPLFKIPTGDDFIVTPDPVDPSKPKTPTYDINRVVLSGIASDVSRVYGSDTLTSGSAYAVAVNGKDAGTTGLNQIVADENTRLQGLITTVDEIVSLLITDGSLDPDKTTQNVGDYKYSSKVNVTANNAADEEFLSNYTFNEAMKNNFNDSLTWKEKMGVDSFGNKVVEGNAKVTPAELVINLNSFDVVYGDTGTTSVNATIGGTNSVTDAQIKETHSGVTNGDDFATLVAVNATNIKNGAFTDNTLSHTSDVGTYEITLNDGNAAGLIKDVKDEFGVHQQYTTYDGNYVVTLNKGTVNVTPKVLTVTGKDVVRNYGNAAAEIANDSGVGTGTPANASNYYGAEIDGWAYTEKTTLESKLGWTNVVDGGTDTSSFSTNLTERVTNHVNVKGTTDGTDYTWSANLNLNNPDLKNYTFVVDGNNSKTTTVGGNSYVNPVTLNVTLNSFDIVYGATLEDTNGNHVADVHDLYVTSTTNPNVYVDNVNSLYTVKTGNFVNGDSVEDVVAGLIGHNNAGFTTGDSNKYEGHQKTVDVQDGITLTATGVSQKHNDYTIGTITAGTVNVKHAILNASGGEDIYRYYGEEQKYKLNAEGTALVKITDDKYPAMANNVAGFVYGEGTKDSSIDNALEPSVKYKLNELVKVTADNENHSDGAWDKVNNKTAGVGAYTWSGGSLTVVTGTMADGEDLQNYRFWDSSAKDVTTTAANATLGGGSYVLPQTVTIKLKDQSIEYGTAKGTAATDYLTGGVVKQNTSGYEITGNYKTAETPFVNVANGDLTANGDTTVNAVTSLAGVTNGEIIYINGKAYVGDKTNNVNGGTPYTDAIDLKTTGVLSEQNFSFIPSFEGSSYVSLGTNQNYRVVIEKGDATITPRALTVKDINGTVVYGDQNGAGVQYSPLEFKDNRVLAGDVVNLTKDPSVVLNTVYKKEDGVAHTADVGTYTNSVTTNVAIDNPNYVLVDNLTDKNTIISVGGSAEVTRANLVIHMNDFKVLYGDTQDSQTINANYTRNPGADNKVSAQELVIKNPVGLVNGDENHNINEIITITGVNDTAFENKGGGVIGTKPKSTGNKLYATTSDAKLLTKTVADVDGVTVITGGTTKNYNVKIVEGSVDVLAKQVVVVDPGKDVPTPGGTFDPTSDNPKEKFNPDAVYVKADKVERTYGDQTITAGGYNVTVSGLASWEATGGTKTLTGVTPATDGGKGTGTTTNNAGKYDWTYGVTATDIAGLGTNYGGSAPITAKGESDVNRAKLMIQLADKTSIIYGTEESAIGAYGPVKIIASGTTYATADTDYSVSFNGLAAQDSTKTYTAGTAVDTTNIFTYTDQNTGYINGVGQNAYNGTTQNTYHHNAVDAKGQGDFTYTSTIGDNFNNPYDNVATIATGISGDNNYEVTILSGNVNFDKKTLITDPSDPNVNITASVVNRIYGDSTPVSGGYTATINSGLASWDNTKEHGIVVKPGHDDGLIGTGDNLNNTITKDVGSYTWSGAVDQTVLPDWIKDNYDFGPITGQSTVSQATITVKANDVTSVYGSAQIKVVVKDGKAPYDVTFTTGGQNGNDLDKLFGVTIVNDGYVDANTTKDAGQYSNNITNISNGTGWTSTANTDGTYTLNNGVAANYKVVVENAKSDITPAELVINLSDHLGIVYGVSEELIKPSYKGEVAAGSTYAGTSNGLAAQDSTKTIADIVTYSHNNTGYVDGVGQPVKDGDGNTIQYAHTTDSTNLENIGFDANGNLTGMSQGGNYKVTFVNGEVTFVPREVKVVDPNSNPGDPSKPGEKPMIEDPLNPGNYVPNPNYDPFNPNNPPFNPNDPSILDPTSPNYDPSYKPNNPDDPRNQIHVLGNTVERNEGNTTIIKSTTNAGTPDGKKNYGIDKITGLPSWITPNSVGVTVGNPVAQDGGVTGPNSTNIPGSYLWSGVLNGLDPNSFNLPAYVPGISIVHPVPVPDVIPPVVEDLYPWLHNTNGDHGWGHQEHWRERKAEVKFVIGGADFFNDLAKAEAKDYEETNAEKEAKES